MHSMQLHMVIFKAIESDDANIEIDFLTFIVIVPKVISSFYLSFK